MTVTIRYGNLLTTREYAGKTIKEFKELFTTFCCKDMSDVSIVITKQPVETDGAYKPESGMWNVDISTISLNFSHSDVQGGSLRDILIGLLYGGGLRIKAERIQEVDDAYILEDGDTITFIKKHETSCF